MWEFAANLTMLWTEREVYDRFSAAAEFGFTRVELLFPQFLNTARIARALEEHGLRFVLFDSRAGDWERGERGLLGLPGREGELKESIEEAIELAKRLDTRLVNVLAGVVPEGIARMACLEIAVENLRRVAPDAERNDVVLLIEALNDVDVPGYLASTVDQAAEIVEAVESPAVGLQFDQYHIAMAGGDPVPLYQRHAQLVRHVQIADAPGRHEPGTGTQPIDEFLRELGRTGYAGSVGLEYAPSTTTEESLCWLEAAWG